MSRSKGIIKGVIVIRIYISVDIEGICGVVSGESTHSGGSLYSAAREQMTAEVNAAVEGALAAGADEVVVNDSHGSMCNLLPEKVNRKALVILGRPKPLVMMEGTDDGEYDGAMFVGYHACNNSTGVLSHTINGRDVDNIWINDMLVGETGINAGVAGYFGIPVIMVTGDNIVAREAEELLGRVSTAVVKEAITRYSARNLHPAEAVDLIKKTAERAVRNIGEYTPFCFKSPVTGKVQFVNSGLADSAASLPGSKRISGDTLAYTSDDYLTVFQALRAMISLAR